MFLRSLTLHDFRNYTEASFTFSPCFNILHGANAQGKTSVLEAIQFLITGRSFRTSDTIDLIRKGASAFHLDALFVKHGVEQRLRVSISAKEKRLVYNNTSLPSLGALLGILHGVALTPDDIELVKGAPCNRRDFLDMQISQINPLYVHHLNRYSRAMRQRNLLLRGRNLLTIESWEHEMAVSAAYLTMERARAIGVLSQACCDVHRKLVTEDEKLHLSYKNGVQAEFNEELLRLYYLEQWNKMRRREMEVGGTLSGPQKDDIDIVLNGLEARYYASEGQQRSCMAAMRFAEWDCLKQQGHVAPLMLIDDVGVSLDESRRERLLKALKPMGQVFVTATSDVASHFPLDQKQSFLINKGKVH